MILDYPTHVTLIYTAIHTCVALAQNFEQLVSHLAWALLVWVCDWNTSDIGRVGLTKIGLAERHHSAGSNDQSLPGPLLQLQQAFLATSQINWRWRRPGWDCCCCHGVFYFFSVKTASWQRLRNAPPAAKGLMTSDERVKDTWFYVPHEYSTLIGKFGRDCRRQINLTSSVNSDVRDTCCSAYTRSNLQLLGQIRTMSGKSLVSPDRYRFSISHLDLAYFAILARVPAISILTFWNDLRMTAALAVAGTWVARRNGGDLYSKISSHKWTRWRSAAPLTPRYQPIWCITNLVGGHAPHK